MAKHVIRWTALRGLLAGLTLGSVSQSAWTQGDQRGTLGERVWYYESEFAATPGLRAKPDQVVILHLAPGGQGGKPIRKAIPYVFPEKASFNFCVPKEDSHIRALELVQESTQAVVVHVLKGAPCQTRTIDGGLYQLHIDYEGKNIPAEGRNAFVHGPRLHQAGGLQTTGGDGLLRMTAGGFLDSLPICGPNGSSFWTSPNNPMYILIVDGAYVGGPGSSTTPGSSTPIDTYPSAQDINNTWNMCKTDSNSGDVVIFNSTKAANSIPWWVQNPLFPANSQIVSYVTDHPNYNTGSAFHFKDLGNAQFTLTLLAGSSPILASGGQVHQGSGSPDVFTIMYKAYRQGAQVPSPQSGEVHLLNAACGTTSIATYVTSNNLADFNQAGIRGFTAVIVRPGPGTAAVVYPSPNYAGTPQYISQETCLTSLPASLAVTPINRDFVAAANQCRGCDLSGVDLSNLNLTGGDFTATVFNGANLTNTNFQSAILDNAKFRSYPSEGPPTLLSGTDFIGAHLHCTDFQDSGLYTASFWVAGPPGKAPVVAPVITRDHSCWLQLQYAQLYWNTFPPEDWQYSWLDGAVIVGASEQALKTTTGSPLDLSGAHLSTTTGLTHVDLTGADLSGADFTGTDLTGATLASANVASTNFTNAILTGANLYAVTSADPSTTTNYPATFTNATLTSATLQKAYLVSALLQGADLNYANLDTANLCKANLSQPSSNQRAATLDGAFLRNVNLAQANLTGASLTDASFYSTSNTGSCQPSPDLCSPTKSCASAYKATLTLTNFTEAYLNGVDFSNATVQATDFTKSYLVGANFTAAALSQYSSTGNSASFFNAALLGANFSNVKAQNADFTSAFVDLVNAKGATQLFYLDPKNYIQFPGYTPSKDSTEGCVEFTYSHQTTLPATDSTATCPDGVKGSTEGCTTAQWQSQITPIFVPSNINCSQATTDFNWWLVF